MLDTGDWVTLHVDGVRYLEKPPLPYWIAAVSLRIFPAFPAFAVHLPLALTVMGLALLGYAWSRRAFSDQAAFYCALFVLTSAGTFLFTRIFIPDALLSLLMAFALYAFLNTLSSGSSKPWTLNPGPYALWLSLALAVLTKGLVALVFFFGTALVFMTLTGDLRHWRRLRPFSGFALFLAVAAPWHVLAGLRNTGGAEGHGFFWFYFINEHVLRFLGRRVPRDYNKLPAALYWSLHIVWLFPWSLFAPTAIAVAWRNRTSFLQSIQESLSSQPDPEQAKCAEGGVERPASPNHLKFRSSRPTNGSGETPVFNAAGPTATFARRTILLLSIFSALVLVFFSLSTNQEYYTLPVYLPLLMLLAAALASPKSASYSPLPVPYSLLFTLGLAITAALAYGLWSARNLPFVPDIGSLLAHRGVGDYTLSMSHFFDLTGPSFAALRLPAALAALAFAVGPAAAWLLHTRHKPFAAVLTVALTSSVFLVAAHIALLRFAPMLSSQNFAATIQGLERDGKIRPDTQIFLYGDQAYGSSLPFYLHRQVYLVDGRSTSMLFGSTFPDAPHIFLTPAEFAAQWGSGDTRKILFVPLELREQLDNLLGPHKILLQETSGKALYTDRALDTGKLTTGKLATQN
jgi:hypothetical protein